MNDQMNQTYTSLVILLHQLVILSNFIILTSFYSHEGNFTVKRQSISYLYTSQSSHCRANRSQGMAMHHAPFMQGHTALQSPAEAQQNATATNNNNKDERDKFIFLHGYYNFVQEISIFCNFIQSASISRYPFGTLLSLTLSLLHLLPLPLQMMILFCDSLSFGNRSYSLVIP